VQPPLIECIADHLRSLHEPLRLTWDDSRRKAKARRVQSGLCAPPTGAAELGQAAQAHV
jgi:hypothetical protein